MDPLFEQELHDAIGGLGSWHTYTDGNVTRKHYLVNKQECMSCLRDIELALRRDTADTGQDINLKLGEWQVLPNQLVPLFTSYREDPDISRTVLKVLVQLTGKVSSSSPQLFQHLEYLQDYKEAFAKKDVFIILMKMLVDSMEAEGEEIGQKDGEVAADGKSESVFLDILLLLCHLVCVPDPRPGDAGYTPTRRSMQLLYIQHFHDEGVLEFFMLLTEIFDADWNQTKAWALMDILYQICTQADPEHVAQSKGKDKDKRFLKDLLDQEQAVARIRNPHSSTRHARFGTTIERRDAVGGATVSASVVQTSGVSKGRRIWGREFKDPRARSEKKQNMFHDPFFVDLEEGSVRDHNQLNPLLRNALDAPNNMNEDVLAGLRKFFDEFVPAFFSSFVNFLRSTASSGKTTEIGREFERPRLLNFISWILEYHRFAYAAKVTEAKKNKEQPPIIDITAIQGALDLDMLQFVNARLREYGKESNIHSSHLVVVLRVLLHQLKTISVVLDSQDSEVKDVGEVLTQNIVKDDVMNHLAWIMINYKSSAHDPRILSYSVEAFHGLERLMTRVQKPGVTLEFQVEKRTAKNVRSATTTAAKEIERLADARVVENLFHLLEKYERHSAQLHSILVKLIYSIIRAAPTNIVVFFELTYFLRIHRIMSNPVVRDRRQGKRFQEMANLLQYILRQFFKCAERNKCVFVELLFRKVHENQKESLLESHTSEFNAILDNYEDESYKQMLERMSAGETFNAMKSRQRALLEGTLPWSAQEDQLLQERYPMYADHPLCADLLAAELPEEGRRTGRQVRKRLEHLGLTRLNSRSAATAGQSEMEAEDEITEPLAKKQKIDDMEATEEDYETMEQDLETLLDAELARAEASFNEVPKDATASSSTGLGPMHASPRKTDTKDMGIPTQASMEKAEVRNVAADDCKPGDDVTDPKAVSSSQLEEGDLELELEKMMEDGVADSLDLEKMMEDSIPNSATIGEAGLTEGTEDAKSLTQEKHSSDRSITDPADDNVPMTDPGQRPAAEAHHSLPAEPRNIAEGLERSQVAESQSSFLEGDLADLIDEELAKRQAEMGQQHSLSRSDEAHVTQQSQLGGSQSSWMEGDLAELIDEALAEQQAEARQPASQRSTDTLEHDLGQIIDEGL